MTGNGYITALNKLGLSTRGARELFGVSQRAENHWRHRGPPRHVVIAIRALLELPNGKAEKLIHDILISKLHNVK